MNNFIVGREGYGEVKFIGETDVFGLNLDEIGKSIHDLIHMFALLPC